jgi:cytochrome c-type biogenesis protein CcmH/NrfF
MSPFCVGLTLASCPSSEALQLRATIAGMVAAGRTNRQIDSFLLANYPKTVIGAPRSPVAWLVPAAAVMAGLAVVVVVAFRRRGGPGMGPPAEPLPPIPPGDSARLAADLRRFAQGTSE